MYLFHDIIKESKLDNTTKIKLKEQVFKYKLFWCMY